LREPFSPVRNKKLTKPSKLILRPAKLDDVDALTALSYKTIRVKYPDIIGKETVEGYIASGAVPTYYRDRNGSITVAVLDDELVGACALMDDQIHLMMVTLDQHRSGIGATMLADGERTLFATHNAIGLESFRDNLQAVTFYEKHGWVITEHFEMPDHGIPMVRMLKSRPDT
jgi:GNAT superfamily N-acetyltransferase